jgi:hypothetical protein
MCKKDVRTILEKRRFAVERIRDELLANDELVGDQLASVMKEINDQIAASDAPGPVLGVGSQPMLPPSAPPPIPGPGI